MATELQKTANRANSLRSTGPRSLAGKQISSRNAISHGLSARFPLLPGESEKQYLELHGAFSKNLQPKGALEQQLVEDIVSIIWRLRRIPRLEMALLQWISYQERVLHDGTGGAVLLEVSAEIVVAEEVGNAVRAKKRDVAVGQFTLEAMRRDLGLKTDRALHEYLGLMAQQ